MDGIGLNIQLSAVRHTDENFVTIKPRWMSLAAAEIGRHVYENTALCNLLMHFWHTGEQRHQDGPIFVKFFLKIYE